MQKEHERPGSEPREQHSLGQQQNLNFYGQQPFYEQPVYEQQAPPEPQSKSLQVFGALKRGSSQYQNSQQERSNLNKIILKEVQTVNDIICLGQDWAILYYYLCGWNMKLVEQYIDVENTHKKMLNYKPGIESAKIGLGWCLICAQQNTIMRNICGDQFCISCWQGQLTHRMKEYSDPFPPCINQTCKIRISRSIAEWVCQKSQQFKKLYQSTICRSYTQLSKTVKVCYGVDCTNCFFIKRPFQITQCNKCKNFICLICGQQRHYPAQCYDIPAWNKLAEQSISFVTLFNYKICSNCKEAVQRRSGCNHMVCRCMNQFCYICGENWVPNHQAHGLCYREKQVRQLKAQKQKQQQNSKDFALNMSDARAEHQRISLIYKKVNELDLKQMKKQIVTNCKIFDSDLYFMENMVKLLRLGLLYKKYGVISVFMQNNLLIKATIENLNKPCQLIYDFLLIFIPKLIRLMESTKIPTSQNKKPFTQEQPSQKFTKQKCKISVAISSIQKYLQIIKK